MRSWNQRIIVPDWYREQEELSRVGSDGTLWPSCWVCSKKEGYPVAVTAYGVKDEGRTAAGIDYTDFYARCHETEDIIRVEGMRWTKSAPKADTAQEVLSDTNILRMAALKALPFFHTGSEAGRVIPFSVIRDLQAAVASIGRAHG